MYILEDIKIRENIEKIELNVRKKKKMYITLWPCRKYPEALRLGTPALDAQVKTS